MRLEGSDVYHASHSLLSTLTPTQRLTVLTAAEAAKQRLGGDAVPTAAEAAKQRFGGDADSSSSSSSGRPNNHADSSSSGRSSHVLQVQLELPHDLAVGPQGQVRPG